MGCGELARVYSRQGRLGEASSLLSETIERLKRSRGEHHPDCIYALWKMAQLKKKQGNNQEATDHCKAALELAKHRLTLDHLLSKLIVLEKNKLEAENG
jgi:tetratricopeptide (TPR) repeat protein